MEKKERLILYATRYCLGRRTFAVDDMVEYLLDNWDSFSKQLKDTIIRDIKRAIEEKMAGEECDIRDWKKILNK